LKGTDECIELVNYALPGRGEDSKYLLLCKCVNEWSYLVSGIRIIFF
jgi:hypothetical protein